MASIRLLPGALADIERLAEFLQETDPAEAAKTLAVLMEGVQVLAKHPFIGRPLTSSTRELLILRGRSGYLAQYEYIEARNEVLLKSFRHQRELDG